MFLLRSEPLPWATIPLRRQLNHPKGGCIRPLRRLKASCGAHGEEANHHCVGQSAVSRLEAGGTVPTIGVLERLATALSATLTPKAA